MADLIEQAAVANPSKPNVDPLTVPCGQCFAYVGTECDPPPDGAPYHPSRYVDAAFAADLVNEAAGQQPMSAATFDADVLRSGLI